MSSQIKMSVGKAEAPIIREGLSDGGHVYLSCSNCQAGLMDFWITRPGELDPATGKPTQWTVQCNCPFCGDMSFQKTVNGGFHPGGYGTQKPDEPNDVVASTRWDNFTPKGSVLVFNVIKENKDAKPIKFRG